MTITQIIEALPQLFSFFVPGALMLAGYNYCFMHNKAGTNQVVPSVVASYCIKILCDGAIAGTEGLLAVHVPLALCQAIYIIVGALAGILIPRLLNWRPIKEAMAKLFRIATHSNNWLNTIDFDDPATSVILRLRDGKTIFGSVVLADNQWITLVEYGCFEGSLENGYERHEDRSITVPVSEILRYEVMYGQNSQIRKLFDIPAAFNSDQTEANTFSTT